MVSSEIYFIFKYFIIYHYYFKSQSIWITLCCGYIRNNEYNPLQHIEQQERVSQCLKIVLNDKTGPFFFQNQLIRKRFTFFNGQKIAWHGPIQILFRPGLSPYKSSFRCLRLLKENPFIMLSRKVRNVS